MPRRHAISVAFTTTCTLFVWLFVLLAPDLAHAFTEDTTYPATSCRRMGDTGTLGTRLDGGVENDSALSSLTIICPLVRDNTQSIASWRIEVSVRDQSGVAGVSCTATSVASFGASVASNTKSTSNAGTGRFTLTMTPASQGAEGHSVLKCTIPASVGGARSGVRAYVVREPEPGEGDSDQKSYTGTYAELATAAAGVFPFITYPDLGKAKPIAAAANDEWILPLVRDRTDKFWSHARFRFNDGDADKLVECWLTNHNEDGSIAGFLSFGPQGGVAPGQATTQVNIDPNAGLNDGPLALYCESIAADVTATMYDLSETNAS